MKFTTIFLVLCSIQSWANDRTKPFDNKPHQFGIGSNFGLFFPKKEGARGIESYDIQYKYTLSDEWRFSAFFSNQLSGFNGGAATPSQTPSEIQKYLGGSLKVWDAYNMLNLGLERTNRINKVLFYYGVGLTTGFGYFSQYKAEDWSIQEEIPSGILIEGYTVWNDARIYTNEVSRFSIFGLSALIGTELKLTKRLSLGAQCDFRILGRFLRYTDYDRDIWVNSTMTVTEMDKRYDNYGEVKFFISPLRMSLNYNFGLKKLG